MQYIYQTQITCSQAIEIEVDEQGIITHVRFLGGCPGNTQGVARLATGRSATEVKQLLKGIPCRDKGTSCPDQLAKALEQMGY